MNYCCCLFRAIENLKHRFGLPVCFKSYDICSLEF